MQSFIALVDALAWPIATFAIAFLFRREFRMTLGRLGQVKYAGVEVSFREDLLQAEAVAQTMSRVEPSSALATPPRIQHEAAEGDATELPGTLLSHHDASTATTVVVAAGSKTESRAEHHLDAWLRSCHETPRLAILDAGDELARALVLAAGRLGDRRSPAPVRAESATRLLVERGWLNSVEGDLIDRLRRLVAVAEHSGDAAIPTHDARRFIELAAGLIDRIASLGHPV